MTKDTLLVSVVNYCDPEFYSTVKSLWDNAENKNKIIFSLVSEDVQVFDFSFIPKNQLIYRHYDLSKYRGGLGWARHLATQVPFRYDFFIQFDSHTYAYFGWDSRAIAKYKKIESEGLGNFIVSYAPANYEILPDGKIDTNVSPTVSMFANDYSDLVPGFTFPHYKILELDEVSVSYWTTCCYLLAPKRWVDEVGISKLESFNTEEISLSIRNYANNWSVFAVGSRDVFHHMSHKQKDGAITRQISRPWADHRKEDYWEHVSVSTDRLSLLMSGKLDAPYEKVKSFFNKTGINKKYLTHIAEYSSHTIIENRPLGMPPRRY